MCETSIVENWRLNRRMSCQIYSLSVSCLTVPTLSLINCPAPHGNCTSFFYAWLETHCAFDRSYGVAIILLCTLICWVITSQSYSVSQLVYSSDVITDPKPSPVTSSNPAEAFSCLQSWGAGGITLRLTQRFCPHIKFSLIWQKKLNKRIDYRGRNCVWCATSCHRQSPDGNAETAVFLQ
jgi:hypothetical protein